MGNRRLERIDAIPRQRTESEITVQATAEHMEGCRCPSAKEAHDESLNVFRL